MHDDVVALRGAEDDPVVGQVCDGGIEALDGEPVDAAELEAVAEAFAEVGSDASGGSG